MALIGSLVATVLGILSGIFLAFATIAVISVFSGGPLNFMNPLYLLWRYHARVTMWGQRAVWSMNSVREIGFPTRTIEERQRQPYVYEPLNLKERRIRLLRVTRCKYDHWESFRGNLVKVSFRGSLVEVSLDNPEFKYLAISYRWGDSKVVSTMPCDGDDKKLCITQSVLSILETVLQCGRTIHVWIDALCIDQKNLDEKSHQVGLMKDVYKNAYEVVVCLGEPTEDSNRAMDAIYPLKKAYHASQNSQTVSSPELPSLVYLGSLLRRPWFSRIWVIQEVAVASSVTIVCGNRAVRLSDFTDVLWSLALFGHEAQIRGHDRKTVNDSLFVRPPEGYTNGVRMAEIKFSLGQPKHMPFSEILMALCHFDSTNPRDKLYALLGFVEDEDLPFRPDYSESNSTENLYKTTASYMLQQDPSMYVLQRAGTGYSRSEALKDLPSWVPDWSSVDKEIKNFGSQKRSEFRAGGAQDRKPRWLNSELLAIDGIAIDTVAHMSSVRPGPPNGNKPNDPEKAALRKKEILQFKAKSWLWFRQAEDMVSSLQASGDTALWKDSEEKVYPIKGKEQETLRGAFTKTVISNERPLDAKPDNALYMSMWRRVVAFHEPDSPGGEVDGNTFNYNSTVTGSTSQRRFFTTKGGLMGLTSPGTRERDEKYEGDTVCIFQGAVTPFIIRKNRVCEGEGQTWTLVGEAYVHGLMEGEGRGNGMVMEEFVLK